MPRKALTILISDLRPFSFNQIPSFTTIELNLYLVIIENVESPPKSIFQTCHATFRMENFPWFDACFAFAGLQDEHQCIETIDDLLDCGS